MLKFAVSEEKNKWLKDKMKSLNIREKDILEKFVPSPSRGGSGWGWVIIMTLFMSLCIIKGLHV